MTGSGGYPVITAVDEIHRSGVQIIRSSRMMTAGIEETEWWARRKSAFAHPTH
jgi:hypothetical protein